ncbi:MAG: DNA cytosine methyltransferase, partial [Hyphomicrobiaceae bacterium]|nr:DNA cytosine methyltransferase [Hyphomicrobiaceae bacterium]
LETYGYHVTENVVDAADFGVPQNRERLFVVASKRKPITIEAPMLEHVPASSFVDLSAGNWSEVEKPGRAERTISQAQAGYCEFGSDPFLIPYYGNGSGLIGRSMDRPIGTIPTGDRWAVVDRDRMRMLTLDEYRQAMGFPEGYVLPKARRPTIKLLGNAVCPAVASSLLDQVQAQAA